MQHRIRRLAWFIGIPAFATLVGACGGGGNEIGDAEGGADGSQVLPDTNLVTQGADLPENVGGATGGTTGSGGTPGAGGIIAVKNDASQTSGADGTGASDGLLDGHGATEAAIETGLPNTTCASSHPFGTPVLVDNINGTIGEDAGARLTLDELIIFFHSDRAGKHHLYSASRASKKDLFGPPQPMTNLNSDLGEDWPTVTEDGLTIYFQRTLPRMNQVFMASRSVLLAQFSGATPVANVASGTESGQPFIAPDGFTLYLFIGIPGDLYETHQGVGGQFEVPTVLTTINTPSSDYFPTPTLDQLTLYFASNRADAPAKGDLDIWMSKRSSPTSRFEPPVNITELNTPAEELPTWISPDNCRLYLTRSGPTGRKIFVAERSR